MLEEKAEAPVDPVGKCHLLLNAHRVRRAHSRAVRHARVHLQPAPPPHQALQLGTDIPVTFEPTVQLYQTPPALHHLHTCYTPLHALHTSHTIHSTTCTPTTNTWVNIQSHNKECSAKNYRKTASNGTSSVQCIELTYTHVTLQLDSLMHGLTESLI